MWVVKVGAIKFDKKPAEILSKVSRLLLLLSQKWITFNTTPGFHHKHPLEYHEYRLPEEIREAPINWLFAGKYLFFLIFVRARFRFLCAKPYWDTWKIFAPGFVCVCWQFLQDIEQTSLCGYHTPFCGDFINHPDWVTRTQFTEIEPANFEQCHA